MFERWTRFRHDGSGRHAPGSAAHTGPDLSAIPPFPAGIDGGLLAVDPAVIGSYVGLPVASVAPLDGVAPTPAGGVPHPTLGALVSEQQEVRRARLRASGMSEDQIEVVVTTISEAATQHRQHAWTVVFGNGRQASLQVFPSGRGRGDFAGYQARFREQGTRSRHAGHPALEGTVSDIPEAHYETYRLGGVVVAMGRAHEAVVKTQQFEAPRADLTLAALAALGLWAVEG
jgi:hypothetical protein